ncbi:DEAD/DEAH box helicase [Micromonospora haikouensis]|uniref:DEAD/DEAH box helicase n=1 Tax=Micromonospora haikouensis TaxID=686309 RepID=UPI003D70E5B3
MRTYGQFRHLPADQSKDGRARWAVVAEPHVLGRLKRVFPRADQMRSGELLLSDTPEIARELAWVMERWPLSPVDAGSAAHLQARDAAYRASEEQVLRILDGHTPQALGWQEPALPARAYQETVAHLVHTTGRVLCADDVGLGKTVSGSLVLRNPDALPALVVTLTHLTRQWERELKRFFPWLTSHVIRSTRAYDPAARRGSGGKHPDVLIMNYHKLAGWGSHLRGKIATVIFDEMQELRHTDTAKYRAAAGIADQARWKVGLTATPVYNYGDEIHSIISVLDPDALGSRDEFLREWGQDEYGQKRRKVANPRALGAHLRSTGLMIRRTRKEVGRELPAVMRIEQPIETDREKLEQMSGDVADMARLILDQDVDHELRFRAAGQLDLKLRQATGIAKAPMVAEFVRLLLETEQKVVLFGWHRDVYDIWLHRLRAYYPVLYTGSESVNAKERNADAFISGPARVLIMSLRSGAGLNGLQNVCSTAVFGELDWSPAQHHQAIGRLARDGQSSPVAAFFLNSGDGSDPPMIELLGIKRQQADPMIDPDAATIEPSAAAAMGRVRALATDVLRRRGHTASERGPVPGQARRPLQGALL